ncbi:MAG: peptidylprolyl isomerase [Myxococcota bacterium]
MIRTILSIALTSAWGAPQAEPGVDVPAQVKEDGAGKQPGILVDRIAAVVNEDVVTESEVRLAARAQNTPEYDAVAREKVFQAALDSLIAEKLIAQKIEEAEIEVTQTDLERAIDDIIKQNSITRAELEQALAARGISMSQYRADLEVQLRRLKLIDMNVRSKVSVSEKEIREEYERRARAQPAKELVQIRHIFFRADESRDIPSATSLANAAYDRVSRGREEFAEVAKEVSEGPTAEEGGSLGEMSTKGLLPVLADAVKSLEPGDISKPLVTPNGVHVVLLEARRYEAGQPFEQVARQIREELFSREMEQQMQIWREELEAGAMIERRL